MRTIVAGLLVAFLAGSGICLAADLLHPGDLGVQFRYNSKEVFPGDTFYLYVNINNPTSETYYGIPLFAIWSVTPEFDDCAYYWPLDPDHPWESGDIHYYTIDVPPGMTEVEVVPPFEWGDSIGDNAATLYLFAGMSNPFFTNVFGSVHWLDIFCHF